MSKPVFMIRIDEQGQESPFGSWFVDRGNGNVFDLSGVKIVGHGVDTVRQMYNGVIRPGVLDLFDKPGLVDFAGHRWHAGRIGRDSGYQYKLQNADLGLILLIKSFHAKPDVSAPHLKIEVSPHLIASETPKSLQWMIDKLASEVLDELEVTAAAVHLRVDVQGWQPPADFEARLHCRSRRVRAFNAIDDVDFASISCRYGRGESYLFGSAGGLQMAVYDKTAEAKVRDKLDFWRNDWSRSANYDPDKPVYRVEFRFHHSVVTQFGAGSVDEWGECMDSHDFAGVSQHLSGLWRYALDSFKFLCRPGVFDPFWSVLRDVSFSADRPMVYRRYHKTSSGFSGKNVELFLGNFISVAARFRMEPACLWDALQRLPFFPLLETHYIDRGKDYDAFRAHVFELLEERYIRWGRAV